MPFSINTPAGAVQVGSDEVASTHYERIKLALSAPGVAPVDIQGDNSSTDGNAASTIGILANSRGYVFNGTTWDRQRAMTGGPVSRTGIQGVSPQLYRDDTDQVESLRGSRLGDGFIGYHAAQAPYLFNGTTWDRVRSAISGNGSAGTGVPGSAVMGYDINASLFRIARTASKDTEDGLGLLGAGNMIFNGTTWDRQRGGGILDNQGSTVGMPGAALMVRDTVGGNYFIARAGAAEPVTGSAHLGVVPYRWDGANAYRERGNEPMTVLSSAARTSTTTSSVLNNYNGRGLEIRLNITSAGTGNLSLSVRSGGFTVATFTAVTSSTRFVIYPGASGGTGQVVSTVVGRSFDMTVTPSDGSSWTYGITADVIV